MTEQSGTAVDSGRDYAHVLAWFRETKGVGIAPTDIVLALRDLDAARAERDRLETLYGCQVGRADLEKTRAEAAEARIANAKRWLRQDPDERIGQDMRLEMASRALNK